MSNIPADVFTESDDFSPDTLANLGPLRRLTAPARIDKAALAVSGLSAHI